MDSLFEQSEYIIAWSVYVLAGLGCSVVWWKLTQFIRHRGWRELLRGLVLVLIFTPWYAADSTDHYAPAVFVLLMDLLLDGIESGMKGGVGLLISTFIMLVVLIVRQVISKKNQS